jgi:hypothetical protein
MNAAAIARFLSKVDQRGPDECWPWKAKAQTGGYGAIRVERKTLLANRVAFFVAHGRWPQPCALHRCDNPLCCNPAHLFEGSRSDNCRDMANKGRASRGSAHWHSKLSEADVLAIQGDRGKVLQRVTAARFGIGQDQVSRIQSGKRWRHVKAA